jgi:hypothetical protein
MRWIYSGHHKMAEEMLPPLVNTAFSWYRTENNDDRDINAQPRQKIFCDGIFRAAKKNRTRSDQVSVNM